MRHIWLTACIVLAPLGAQSAGLFLAPRGVRPMAMGGAFVAGADDVNALSYNPAGLADAVDVLQADAALPLHNSTYTRSVYGDGIYESPVQGQGLGLPSPMLGVVHGFGLAPGLHFGLALATDTPLMQNWPSVDDNPLTPQRYAVGDYAGTALGKVIIGVGYRFTDWLRLGATAQVLVGNFSTVTTASTCDGVMCTQPENPAYDATLQLQAHGLAVPGAQVGLQVMPTAWLTVGLAWESGYVINSNAAVAIRLPSAAAYNDATLDPSSPNGHIQMSLPQQWRAGAQVRLPGQVRLEAAFVYEPWSVHDTIELGLGNATMRNMLGVGNYTMSALSIPQGYRDTWSARLGGEFMPRLPHGAPLVLRAGVMYEPSAVPAAMLTPMMVDLTKVLAAVGARYSFDHVHVEATLAHVFMFDQSVTQSQVYQPNPTKSPSVTPIGNGTYSARANVFGLGMRLDI